MSALTLLVLRCGDLAACQAFYGALGLALTPERHGDGPEHYAAQIGSLVLELYPARSGLPIERGRLGFSVVDLDAAIAGACAAGGSLVRRGAEAALLRDPDGRSVEIVAADG